MTGAAYAPSAYDPAWRPRHLSEAVRKRAPVTSTNGTSLSPEAPQTSARTEFCNNTRLADVGFLSSFLESPFYVQFFASLAQYQLYRDAVAATGCFSAILTAGCAGPSDSPPLLTGIGWERCSGLGEFSSSYALSSNVYMAPVYHRSYRQLSDQAPARSR
jgi:hypothetical protein